MLLLKPDSGAAGDMLVAALADLGADRERIVESVSPIAECGFREVRKKGVKALRFDVDCELDSKRYPDLVGEIKDLDLKDGVEELSLNILEVLGEAEARAHDTLLDEVHLHEAADCIVDAVAFSVALESLNMLNEEIYCTPVSVGSIAPATRKIIEEHQIPMVSKSPLEFMESHSLDEGEKPSMNHSSPELSTPTGAAILAALDPVYTFKEYEGSRGFGAGDMDLSYPNALEAVDVEEVYMLESNIDDSTPEELSHAMDVLMREGVMDVSLHNCLMKKGRPGFLIRVLTGNPEKHTDLLMRETGTLGVRKRRVEREVLDRSVHSKTITLNGVEEEINVKETRYTCKPEYEDLKRLARKHGLSLRQVKDKIKWMD